MNLTLRKKKISISLIFFLPILLFNIAYGESFSNLGEYILKFTSLKSDFIQYNPDETLSFGTLYLKQPRYMRWHYIHPEEVVVNVNGPFTTYYNKELDQSMSFPTKINLANILYNNCKTCSFSTDQNNKYLIVNQLPQEIAIILKFAENPLDLIELDMLYEGERVKVSFSNTEYNPPINNRIFSNFD